MTTEQLTLPEAIEQLEQQLTKCVKAWEHHNAIKSDLELATLRLKDNNDKLLTIAYQIQTLSDYKIYPERFEIDHNLIVEIEWGDEDVSVNYLYEPNTLTFLKLKELKEQSRESQANAT